MKNRKFLKFPILGLLAVMVSAGVVFDKEKQATPVDAYAKYSESTLPTTIDLNDASDETIRNYYSSLNGKSSSELKGTNLLKNLKPVLSNGQKYFSYDGTSAKNAIWKAYEITDRDWARSPKEEIEGYNATENKIYNYTYKASTSFSDPKNPYVHALYVNRDMDNPMKAWGNHDQKYGGINQEHIWAKSHGFDQSGAGGARGDLMHLWAGDGIANRIHNNYVFGYVDKSNKSALTIPSNDYAKESMLGPSRTLPGKMVFEPQDSDKGDIARAIFYMAARYNNYAGATTGIDSDEPNLVVDNIAYDKIITGYQSATTETGKYGVLKDLLEWNKLDPVDEYEIHRNNLLFNNYTFNRNPFIDFPSWANSIWGDEEGNTNYGSVDPAHDVINGYQTSVAKPIDRIEITSLPYKVEFAKNEVFTSEGLKVKAYYTDGENEEVNGFNVDKKGALTEVGQQTVTVTYREKTATYDINVVDGQVFTLKILPQDFVGKQYALNNNTKKTIAKSSLHEFYDEEVEWTSYQVRKNNGAVSFQANEGVIYNNTKLGTIANITINSTGGTFSQFFGESENPTSGSDTGGGYFSIKWSGNAAGYASSIIISYLKPLPETPDFTGIVMKDFKSEFKYGEEFTGEDVEVYKTFTFGDDLKLETSDLVFSEVKTDQLGTQDVEVSYTENEVTYKVGYEIEVVNYLASIQVVGNYKVDYEDGEDFDDTGIQLKLNYADGSSETITKDFEFVFPDEFDYGENAITVKYQDLTTTFNINLLEPEPEMPDIVGMLLGCLGSIEQTSIIISVFAIAGVGLILLKKKRA